MSQKIITKNKKAHLDYQIKETLLAGIVLKGFEVKAIKRKGISLKGAYISIIKGEPYLVKATIPEYQKNNAPRSWDKERPRKLLLKKKEITYLQTKRKQEKLIIIPLEVIEERNLIKIKIALAKPQKKYEKKEKIKERELKRRIQRYLKSSS